MVLKRKVLLFKLETRRKIFKTFVAGCRQCFIMKFSFSAVMAQGPPAPASPPCKNRWDMVIYDEVIL